MKMKKPLKQPQLKWEISYFIEDGEWLTAEKLREIADIMDDQNIHHICCEIEGYEGSLECKQQRVETKEEAEKRYNKEMKKYEREKKNAERRKEGEKKRILAAAKRLGLKIADE